jgi:hypothetical protein
MAENWTAAATVAISGGTASNVSPAFFDLRIDVGTVLRNDTSWENVTVTPTIVNSSSIVLVLRLFDSELERALFELYLWVNGLLSLALNFLVLAVVRRESLLHTTEHLIIAGDATNNIVMVLANHAYILAVMQLDLTVPNSYVCQVFGFLSTFCFAMTSYLVVIYSYERYLIFCNPIAYSRRITKPRVVGAIFGILVKTVIVSYMPPNGGVIFSTTTITCISRDIRRSVFAGLASALLPALAAAAYAVVSIKQLQRRWA